MTKLWRWLHNVLGTDFGGTPAVLLCAVVGLAMMVIGGVA